MLVHACACVCMRVPACSCTGVTEESASRGGHRPVSSLAPHLLRLSPLRCCSERCLLRSPRPAGGSPLCPEPAVTLGSRMTSLGLHVLISNEGHGPPQGCREHAQSRSEMRGTALPRPPAPLGTAVQVVPCERPRRGSGDFGVWIPLAGGARRVRSPSSEM